MNIIVRPYGSKYCYCRPDTTWERESKDFYSPECIDDIFWAPVVFARVCKAGKCVSEKFAERYYEGVGYGVLMYCRADAQDSTGLLSCVDHTSILPATEVAEGDPTFKVTVDTDEAYSVTISLKETQRLLEEAICSGSRLVSLRIGDLIAVEIEGASLLSSRTAGNTNIQGTVSGNESFNINIIW